ncbi:MAG: hypothetical protein L3J43_01190 [Sulfurovum sp.]|nr:hypothetical protein [Sulfurovum sp.]
MKKLITTTNVLKIFFTLAFILAAYFVIVLETERYQSDTLITIRDLSKKQTPNNAFDMLSQSSPVMQDSKLVELYMRSDDMFTHLEKKFNLTSYYAGEKMDIIRRLSPLALMPFYSLNKENLLAQYNKDLTITYDVPSTALKVGFAHADNLLSRSIVKEIIKYSSETLNRLERENAEVALTFLKKQVQESKASFTQSIKKMIMYQNAHNTIDPNLDVQSRSTILANLESDLIKKTVEFQSGGKYMIKNSSAQKIAIATIENLKKEIKRVKKEIAGTGMDKKELNQVVFDFELLRNDIDFSKEVYKQSLEKLEELRSEVNQNIKNLLIINTPTLAENYTYPEKPKKILTIFIILAFLYGILISILTLLRDHRD